MPRTFEIGLPDKFQREKILRLQLKNEAVDQDFDFHQLSVDCVYYSGSDLKELCRAALMIPLREHIDHVRTAAAAAKKRGQDESELPQITMRPLSMADFQEAKTMVQPTGATAYAYETSQRDQTARPPTDMPMDMEMFATIMAAGLQQMMQMSSQGNSNGRRQ